MTAAAVMWSAGAQAGQTAVPALSATVPASQAAPAGQPVLLDLQKAVEIALSENPTIKVADLEIARQDYVRGETLSNHLPQLSAGGQYVRSIVKQEMAKGISFGADNTFTATADLTVPLFAKSVYATLKMNEAQMLSAVEAARASRIELVNEVKKAYYNILLAQQSLEVLRESESTVQETVDNTRSMYENGLASEYDLLSAEVQLSNLRPNIIQTENSIVLAKMLLKMYMGMPQNVDIQLAGTLDGFSETVSAADVPLSTDSQYNSDLRALDLQIDVLDRQLKVVNSQRWPTVAAFGQFIMTGNDMERFDFGSIAGGSASGGSSKGFWWQHPLSVGVSISVPIFSGLKTNKQAKQVKNSAAQLRLQRDYLEESVNVEIRNSINSLIAAREMMYANEKTVAQADKAYAIAQTRYNSGVGTILELNSSELDRTRAHLNYSQSIYDYLSARADYDRTMGYEFIPGQKGE